MFLRAKPRWQLPGPSVPYLVVWRHDEAARDTRRCVSPETALKQLDNWAISHHTTLLEMAAALQNKPPSTSASRVEHLWFNAQLKSRIAAAIQAGRLVVLEAELPPPSSMPKKGAAPAGPQAGATPTTAPAVARQVTYKFDLTSSSSLRMPYAVAINGVVVKHADKPGSIKSGKSVTIEVPSNSTVSLYLNSDALPSHRKQPVYGITPKDRDLYVTITEKTGKHSDSDTPVFEKRKSTKGKNGEVVKEVDHYTAPLTGDLWMKVSHKYSEADAKSYLPATTDSVIRKAVLSIYREELTSSSLKLDWAAQGTSPSHTLTVTFADSSNPTQNITSFSLLKDGLTRVHPKAFLALLEAARTARLTKMTISSNWRPLLGSIAHRAGLGVDVSYIEDATHKVTMNREELRKDTPDLDWVSVEEKELFTEYEAAKEDFEAKLSAERLAKKTLANAETALKTAKKQKNQTDITTAQAKKSKAETALESARKEKEKAKDAYNSARTPWKKELDANEPACVRKLRNALKDHSMVKQFFDPWYMDSNTRDKIDASPNEQCTANEKLHAHHLHITVHEPDLLS